MIQRVINWQLNLRISQNMDFQLRAPPIISTLLLKLCQISESMAKENLKMLNQQNQVNQLNYQQS